MTELPFSELMFVLIGAAVAVGLVVMVLVYAGGSRGGKRYRPGRPFEFTPVWFLAAPEEQARAGLVAGGLRSVTASPGTELTSLSPRRVARPQQTGGASDRW